MGEFCRVASESLGQLHEDNTYAIRWTYRLSTTGVCVCEMVADGKVLFFIYNFIIAHSLFTYKLSSSAKIIIVTFE